MRNVAAFFVLALATAVAHAQVWVFPATPAADEEFVVVVSVSGCGGFGPVTPEVKGTVIVLGYTLTGGCFGGEPPVLRSAAVRVPAPGTYEIQTGVRRSDGTIDLRLRDTVNVGPSRHAARPTMSLNGLWSIPSEPGWGVRIVEGTSGQLFVLWFTYQRGTAGTNRWYVAPSGTWTPEGFVAPFYSAGGRPFQFGTFDPSMVRLEAQGVFTIKPESPDTVRLSVRGNDYTGPLQLDWTLTRLRF